MQLSTNVDVRELSLEDLKRLQINLDDELIELERNAHEGYKVSWALREILNSCYQLVTDEIDWRNNLEHDE